MSERQAISIDPDTGRKRFDTRAAANPRVQGSGYRVIDDERLTTLPEQPVGASFDDDARDRYRRDKHMREGSGDFVALDGEFSRYLVDHYSAERVERDVLDDECEILVVGAGFSGLLLWYRLSQAGFDDVRFCERGGDVGGTWYWNRYPGVACDVESYSYLPLLEEMGHIPSVKFASGFEILDYCRQMAERFDFYDRCLFHTSVTGTDWDDTDERWIVRTDRGDAMRARHVILANGILTTPQLANIPGIDRFGGESFHTSRWNYDVDLAGKRIGVIGTGATAVQAVPELAKVAGELFVFQRTPSTVDVRDQRETTEEERTKWAAEPGWAVARRTRFARISAGRTALQANDAYLAGEVDDWKERKQHDGELDIDEYVEKLLDTNFRIMEQIRARVDEIVDDPAVADVLKPWYPYGCKRPTFHDEYLPAFNLSHVHLVDCAPTGVREINERGVVHEGTEYELDVLIFATGFRFFASDVFDMVRGRDGRSITDKWADGGTRSFLGVHHSGYPNLYVITGPQGGGGSFNFTDSIEDHVRHVVRTLEILRERGDSVIDVSDVAEAKWARHCARADSQTAALRDCVSYYNGYGGARAGSLAYYGGAKRWRDSANDALDTLEPFALR
jgi:cation diffusion facilitator CzcD-associated flavoprotein CzcO